MFYHNAAKGPALEGWIAARVVRLSKSVSHVRLREPKRF